MDFLKTPESPLLNALRGLAATDNQVAFVQEVLGHLSGGPLFWNKCLARPNVTFASTWCDYVIREHQVLRPQRQPRHGLTMRILTGTVALIDRHGAVTGFGTSDWATAVRALRDTPERVSKEVLPDLETSLSDAQETMFSLICSSTMSKRPSRDQATYFATETATRMLLVGQTAEGLYAQLLAELQIGWDLRQGLTRCLAPHRRKYSVVVGVVGLDHSASLDLAFRPLDLRALNPAGDVPRRWVSHADKLHDLQNTAAQMEGKLGWDQVPRVTLLVEAGPLYAVDSRQAAAIAADRVRVALDRVMMGSPEIAPSVFPIALALDSWRGEPALTTINTHRLSGYRPKPVAWPDALAPVITAAANARRQVSPSVQAALSWVALETMGVEPTNSLRQNVAKSLALFSLRQVELNAFQRLMAGAPSNHRESRSSRKMAERWSARADRRHANTAHLEDSTHQRAVMQQRLSASLYRHLANLYRHQEERWRARLVALPLIEHFPDDDVTLLRLTRLVDPMLWERLVVEALAQPWSGDDTVVTVREVYKLGDPLTRSRVSDLAMLLSEPGGLAALLEDQKAWIDLSLSQLYCVRNLSLHAGQEVEIGAHLLADLGLSMLDSLMDIFATWYSDGSHNLLAPEEVLAELGRRFDSLISDESALRPLAHWSGPPTNPTGPRRRRL